MITFCISVKNCHRIGRSVLKRLNSLTKRKAEFIEPMECALVSKHPEGPDWTYEVLCGGPHTSSVAFGVMWRWGCDLG